ncbi:hypothetical protein GCM10022206_23080 [Streptomyces chiangmaiensis]
MGAVGCLLTGDRGVKAVGVGGVAGLVCGLAAEGATLGRWVPVRSGRDIARPRVLRRRVLRYSATSRAWSSMSSSGGRWVLPAFVTLWKAAVAQ